MRYTNKLIINKLYCWLIKREHGNVKRKHHVSKFQTRHYQHLIKSMVNFHISDTFPLKRKEFGLHTCFPMIKLFEY